MKNRIAVLPGTPARHRVPVEVTPRDKIEVSAGTFHDWLPTTVRIEVAGGRSCTASAMRAARVQQELEEVGAAAETVELEGGHAALEAEADARQLLHVARSPFVRKIRVF